MVHATPRPSTATYPDLEGQAVSVLGIARSGIAATRLLQAVGARVTIADEQPNQDLSGQLEGLDRQTLQICRGQHFDQAFRNPDLIVVSPGVPTYHRKLDEARRNGVPIVGELELAYWFLRAPVIAVTGTNGKSTTVRLVGQIMQESGNRVFVGGNLGTPLCEGALESYQAINDPAQGTSPYDYFIVEVSSFQLETIQRFRPWVAAVLNITPDHLDRYPSFTQYKEAKERILENQTLDDFSLMNLDDPLVAEMARITSASVVGFSLERELAHGVFLDGSTIRARVKDVECSVIERDQVGLRGRHNLSNVLAAVAIGLLADCPAESLRSVLSRFSGVEHAIEFVRERKGVVFVNDSKGTNVSATLRAIESFEEPIVLIIGGKDKGGDFSLLREPVGQRVKLVIVMGESASSISQVLHDVRPLFDAGNLSEAVELAVSNAVSGDVVLFSPSCASFDMFQNYEERGRKFKELVNALPG